VIPLVPTVIKLLLWMRSHRDAVFSGDQGHVFVNGRGNRLSRGWLSLKMQRAGRDRTWSSFRRLRGSHFD
jgi:hypothetical protein